jgi:hypothetical protein
MLSLREDTERSKKLDELLAKAENLFGKDYHISFGNTSRTCHHCNEIAWSTTINIEWVKKKCSSSLTAHAVTFPKE